MRVAIIGIGEVGRCFAKALHRSGAQLELCDARPAPAAIELAATLGLALHHAAGPWLQGADWVLSCVTGGGAHSVAESFLPHVPRRAGYADLTTASPATKRQIAALAGARGVAYLDVAIMGAITLHWERTPLLAAGNNAKAFAGLLEPVGGRVTTIEGGAPGDAVSLKILRSIFTKGMEALSVELLTSAEQQGVRTKLYEQLGDIDQTPLQDFIEMLVRTHVVHAARRAHEVHDAQAELESQGLPSLVLPGVEQKFLDTARKLQGQPVNDPHPSIEAALEWLLATHRPATPATHLLT